MERGFAQRPVILGLAWGFLAWLGALCGASAQATVPRAAVYLDAGGLPRCVTHPSDSSDGLLLIWNADVLYGRLVYAVSTRDFRLRGAPATSCGCWPQMTAIVNSDVAGLGSYPTLPNGAREFALPEGRYSLPPDALAGLVDVRRGSNVALRGVSARTYLAQNPIVEFTREHNRWLARSFGVGYAAEIYRAWLETLPTNADFRARAIATVDRARSGQLERATSERMRGYRVFVAQGYLQTERNPALGPLFAVFDELGIQHRIASLNPLSPIAPNAASLEAQIADELRRSDRRVILVGASKGVPELMTALANLNTREPALLLNVAAVVSLAGMFDGSFLVDWASEIPQRWFVGGGLQEGLDSSGLPRDSDLSGFFAMSTASLRAASAFYAPRLPALRYFNFVGILGGDGWARSATISRLQSGLAIPRVGSSGGNDGYIEYPGTAMPRTWGLRSTDVVFESSHGILDGWFNGRDLTQARERRATIEGLFVAIADAIESR